MCTPNLLTIQRPVYLISSHVYLAGNMVFGSQIFVNVIAKTFNLCLLSETVKLMELHDEKEVLKIRENQK